MLMTRVDEWYGAPEKERARKGKRERERGNGARERQKEGKERIGRTAGQIRVRACAWPRNRAERSLSACLRLIRRLDRGQMRLCRHRGPRAPTASPPTAESSFQLDF